MFYKRISTCHDFVVNTDTNLVERIPYKRIQT